MGVSTPALATTASTAVSTTALATTDSGEVAMDSDLALALATAVFTAASMEAFPDGGLVLATGLDIAGFGAETTDTGSDLATGLDITAGTHWATQARMGTDTPGFGTADLDTDTPGFTGRFDLFDGRNELNKQI